MSVIGWIVAVTMIAGVGGTGLGGVVSTLFRKDSDRVVSLLLSFAAGVMLSVVCFDLVADAIHPDGGGQTQILLVIAGIALGYIVVYLLNHLIDRSTFFEVHTSDSNHPTTHDDLDELIHLDHYELHRQEEKENNTVGNRSGLFMAGVVMACAIALHNMPEGMVIGASYASDSSLALNGSTMVLAMIIGLHNIPEGMAVAVPLISGGMAKWKAVLITALSGAPTILGAIIGYYLGAMGPLMLALSLSFASGAMLYVVFGELLPEAILMWRSKLPSLSVFIGVLVGLLIIYS
jgi:ZIP family zinc transporter